MHLLLLRICAGKLLIFYIIKSGEKLLNADWLRQKASFLKSVDVDWVFLLLAATGYWLQFNWMKPCDVGNCTFRIKCSLNLLVSYICFDISSSIERAKSCRHYAQMQFPQKFFPLCDKQVIASALGPMGSEIQNIKPMSGCFLNYWLTNLTPTLRPSDFVNH